MPGLEHIQIQPQVGIAEPLLVERRLPGTLEADEDDGLHGMGRGEGWGRFGGSWNTKTVEVIVVACHAQVILPVPLSSHDSPEKRYSKKKSVKRHFLIRMHKQGEAIMPATDAGLVQVIANIKSFSPEKCNDMSSNSYRLDFQGAFHSVQLLHKLISDIDFVLLDAFPETNRESFIGMIKKHEKYLSEIGNFDGYINSEQNKTKQPNGQVKKFTHEVVKEKAEDICKGINSNCNAMHEVCELLRIKTSIGKMASTEALQSLFDSKYHEHQARTNNFQREATNEFNKTLNDYNAAKAGYDTLVVDLKNRISDVNVLQQKEYFAQEALQMLKGLYFWMTVALILFVALACTSVYFYVNAKSTSAEKERPVKGIMEYVVSILERPVTKLSVYDFIQLAVSKVVIIAILLYGILISVKNMYAYQHLYAVNRHRHNAIASFPKFVEVIPKDDQFRHVLLAQVAASVFAAQETGFLKDHGDTNSAETLTKLIKDVVAPPKNATG